MAINLCDIVLHRLGKKMFEDGHAYVATEEDFACAGLPMFVHCATCGESLSPWKAFPSSCNAIFCEECLPPDSGFESAEDFERFIED